MLNMALVKAAPHLWSPHCSTWNRRCDPVPSLHKLRDRPGDVGPLGDVVGLLKVPRQAPSERAQQIFVRHLKRSAGLWVNRFRPDGLRLQALDGSTLRTAHDSAYGRPAHAVLSGKRPLLCALLVSLHDVALLLCRKCLHSVGVSP
jgi:hypothetical protein